MRLPKRSRTRANGMVVWRSAFQLPCRAVVPQSRDEGGSASQISGFNSTLFEAGQKMWQRGDGAILWLRGPLIVRLELPAAREYEAQLKAAKEKKARESVPQ